MKIAGDYTFRVGREELWKALLDPQVLANTLPGAEELEQVGENQFQGKLTIKVGPVQGVFEGRVELSDLDPPNGYSLSLSGQGAPGFVNGKGRLTLEDATLEDGGEAARLRYDIDAQVGGRIAAVGQRLLDSSAKVITRQGLEGLERQLQARGRLAASRDPSSPDHQEGAGESKTAENDEDYATVAIPSKQESQAAFARGFLAGLIKELVPQGSRWLKPEVVVLAATLIVLLGVAISLRACQG